MPTHNFSKSRIWLFICKRTNRRTDEWGGDYLNRIRLPLEIVAATREKVGSDFIVIFRLSMLDLVQQGSTWQEIVMLAKRLALGLFNFLSD